MYELRLIGWQTDIPVRGLLQPMKNQINGSAPKLHRRLLRIGEEKGQTLEIQRQNAKVDSWQYMNVKATQT